MVMPEPVPLPGTAPLRTPPGTARYSVPEAARALGISERAVRKRITAGSIPAEKEGHAWAVFLPPEAGAVPDAEPEPRAAPGAVLTEPEGGTEAAPGAVPDLAPLVALVERQGDEIVRLTEAATIWQLRARQAEEKLLALEAHVATADTDQDAPTAAPAPLESPPPPEKSIGGLRGWLRRLLGA